MAEIKNVKLCRECNEVKELNEKNFYKAGKSKKTGKYSYQKYCVPCHNAKRHEYKLTASKYVKKVNGFKALPEDIQEKIKYDIYVKISYKEIAEKYNINYGTFASWRRKNEITPYIPTE